MLGTMREIPQKIGKYKIRSARGEGGSGIVYEAYDPDIERRVAIKILHPHLNDGKQGAELLARFKREAISTAKCVHPNIVTILEYGQDENRPFIVMEYVDGVSVERLIKHRLKHRQSISLKHIFSIISQLLRALHAAHKLNIVHRDVKASNVLILKDGRIKLADFGMARLTENPDLTMIGTLLGTPRYMAPELRVGYEADSRADIFSATRLFLELLKLTPDGSPFPRSKLAEIANMPPGNRIDYSAVYPTALIPVVTKGLEVDREKRYQTVQEFMQAIKKVLPKLQQKAATSSGQAASVPRESVQDFPASEDELDSMTTLLADIIGPVATVIMEEHETKSTSAINLVTEISKEIPEPEKQEEFLKRWELMSVSKRASINKKGWDTSSDKTKTHPLQKEVLDRIGYDYAHYIGPIAGVLLRQYSARTSDFDQLVRFLGREIPDRREGQKFIKSWLSD
ncbi:MAG: serine/threonine protein kinase [Gammaproteobacteria bacterium]|nr:serine/threonine protein kinase [Gammaproteobacteria bacterium]